MGLNSALGHAPYVGDRRSHRAHNLKSEWLEGRDSQSTDCRNVKLRCWGYPLSREERDCTAQRRALWPKDRQGLHAHYPKGSTLSATTVASHAYLMCLLVMCVQHTPLLCFIFLWALLILPLDDGISPGESFLHSNRQALHMIKISINFKNNLK